MATTAFYFSIFLFLFLLVFTEDLRWHLCLFVKHFVCDTEDETFGTASLAKNAAERRNNRRFGAPRGARPADKVRPGDDCVRLSPGGGGGLRVRGERSK